MLTEVELKKFREYLPEWLAFGRDPEPADWLELQESISEIYVLLGLEEPQIIPCRGPLQQLIFPVLVNLMMRLGEERSKESSLKIAQMEPQVVRGEWTSLWQEAFDSIDWIRNLPGTTGNGTFLYDRMERLLKRILKIKLVSAIDNQIGAEKHETLERETNDSLTRPFQQLERALLLGGTEPAHIWNSLIMRLPQPFLDELKIVRREQMYSEENKSSDEPFQSRRVDRIGPAQTSWMGAWDWYWLASADFARKGLSCKLDEPVSNELDHWMRLTTHATAYLFYENCCYVFLKPRTVSQDDSFRAHHPSKAAVEFVDNTALYFWHGIEVPDHLIKQPQKLFIRHIEAESNAELRRIMIEIYGLERFIKDSSAKQIHQDNYGTLYRKELRGDEAVIVVKVKNSTPEPDGSFKDYFLRVPPETRTAKAAVAWTFGLSENEYKPTKET